MGGYELFIEKDVYKQLKNIPERDYQKIMGSIASLANNPRPPGCKNLKPARAIEYGKEITVLFMKLMTKSLLLLLLRLATERKYTSNHGQSSCLDVLTKIYFHC